jgi:hypothetical protein
MGSVDGFLDRPEEFLGFSIPSSDLIIAGDAGLTRVRRRGSASFGSLIKVALYKQKQQFTGDSRQPTNYFRRREQRTADCAFSLIITAERQMGK